jgi:hypothetical protein
MIASKSARLGILFRKLEPQIPINRTDGKVDIENSINFAFPIVEEAATVKLKPALSKHLMILPMLVPLIRSSTTEFNLGFAILMDSCAAKKSTDE